MVDSEYSRRHIEKFNSDLEKLSLRLPDYVGITHWQWTEKAMNKPLLNGEYIHIPKENFE